MCIDKTKSFLGKKVITLIVSELDCKPIILYYLYA